MVNLRDDLKPKILVVNFGSDLSQQAGLAIEDLQELYRHGYEWRVLGLEGSEFVRRAREIDAGFVKTWEQAPRQVFDFRLRRELKNELDRGFNVLHVIQTDLLGSILPWVTNNHELPIIVSEGPDVSKKMRHLVQSLFYQRIDALLVPSKSLRDRVVLMRPVLEKKVKILYPGLDFQVFNPEHFDFKILRRKWNIEDDCYLVGMIASQEYTKAQGSFIRGAASFLRNEELAQRTKFVIVGFRANENPDLVTMIKQFHLEEKIILAPEEEFVPLVLGTLDVFVLPSTKAMFGLQAIEAMAIGTPLICANGPDSIEWIGNSHSGYLMRSGDSFDLQRKLLQILENPEQLRSMGKKAVEYARSHYDRNVRTNRLIEIYTRSLKRRKKWAEVGDEDGAHATS